MSIGILIKQKKFIAAELKKGNKDYEEIYQMAKYRQQIEEKILRNVVRKYKKELEKDLEESSRKIMRRVK